MRSVLSTPRLLLSRSLALAALATVLLALPAAAQPVLCNKRCQKTAKKITIDVQDADVVNVVRLMADVTGLNFVVADDVKGKVSMKLKNVRWDRALAVILKTKGLVAVRERNIVRVIAQKQWLAEQQTKLDARTSCEDKAPLKTRLIPVNYGVAKEMAEQVKATLSKRGSVAVDERTNTIIVRDVDCP